jgi:hypothetical protein
VIHVLLTPSLDASNVKPETRPIFKTIELTPKRAQELSYNGLQIMLKKVRPPTFPPLRPTNFACVDVSRKDVNASASPC